MIYLDYNATAPLRPEVIAVIQETLAFPYNPSSIHAMGRKARQLLEDARSVVAESVGAWPNEVIFTGSGSEANNMALRAAERPLLVGATEHSSVLVLAQRLGGDVLPVDHLGIIDLNILESKLKHLGKPALVSVMLANNETGVIQPIQKIAALVKQYDGLLHCDAVQALGKIPFDMGMLGADMLTLCAHKFGGPVGIGALIVRNDLPVKPFIIGGGQELNRRAGTQTVALAAGFAKAIELGAKRGWIEENKAALDALQGVANATAGEDVIIASAAKRLPNTLCLRMPNVVSETQLMNFDLEGFCISAGSACSSGRIEPSHVLRAMGYADELAATAVRISVGWSTKPEEITRFRESWVKLYQRLAKKAA
jgi:cysteine desulfurase